jgi:hypothetical protein
MKETFLENIYAPKKSKKHMVLHFFVYIIFVLLSPFALRMLDDIKMKRISALTGGLLSPETPHSNHFSLENELSLLNSRTDKYLV